MQICIPRYFCICYLVYIKKINSEIMNIETCIYGHTDLK